LFFRTRIFYPFLKYNSQDFLQCLEVVYARDLVPLTNYGCGWGVANSMPL
jgi:hypothetical protein